MRKHLIHAPTPSPSPAPAPSPQAGIPSPSTAEILPSSLSSSSSVTTAASTSTSSSSSPPPSKLPVQFSPPLIAMVVIIISAFIVITYSRLISRQFLHLQRRYLRWRLHRRRYVPSSSASNIESPPYPFDLNDAFHVLSPYGLDDSAIKTIPLSVHTRKSSILDCAVCLLEFEENDYVRTLPVCSHAFHVDCIDIWLKSHANCPLCRAIIFRPESPFIPVMATRIRPSLDDMIIESTILEPLTEFVPESDSINAEEITQDPSPRRNAPLSEDCSCSHNRRDFLLKRSYSFGFERNLGSERLVLEPVTASPWRYRRGGVGSFWNKRPSPFSSLTKPRVFSFRYYRGMNMKSPFFRRRGSGGGGVGGSFYPLSESSVRFGGGSTSAGGGESSRRSNKSFASPMFMRNSGTSSFFSSSRHRSGDPEALLSPDRYTKR
ncbi:OLC1v1003105C1 [Oldenlandia corymbosa var. corymbosa]|uniref:RING-type E3 ubiquitin transferase n=1 Tax=Oldenlandia corymbosa var. corymbosa TaxID=529605 RepID=A0AAV1D9A6_OLDCO|nr:OLC1v1003105C1 [Oldenlandia corymbosa var. corymbosa]